MKKGKLSEIRANIESDFMFYDECLGDLTEGVKILEERNGALGGAMIDLLSLMYRLSLWDSQRKELKKIARGLGMKLNKS